MYKKVITIGIIALCGVIAGVAALGTVAGGKNNVRAAFIGYGDVSINSANPSLGSVCISGAVIHNGTDWEKVNINTASLTAMNVYIYIPDSFATSYDTKTSVTFTAIPSSGYAPTYWRVDYVLLSGEEKTYYISKVSSFSTKLVELRFFSGYSHLKERKYMHEFDRTTHYNFKSMRITVGFGFVGGESSVTTKHSLSVISSTGGSILSGYGSRTVNTGTEAEIRAVADEGYVFSGWTIISGLGNATLRNSEETTGYVTVNGTTTVQANFKKLVVYILNTNVYPAGNGGMGRSPTAQSGSNGYYSGTRVTLTAPSDGYEAVNWIVEQDGNYSYYGKVQSIDVYMMANTTVTVNVQVKAYTFEVTSQTYDGPNLMFSGGGGQIMQSVVSSTYTFGTEIVLTVTSHVGFELRSLTIIRDGISSTVDIKGSTVQYAIVMEADTVVIANFNKMYKLEVG